MIMNTGIMKSNLSTPARCVFRKRKVYSAEIDERRRCGERRMSALLSVFLSFITASHIVTIYFWSILFLFWSSSGGLYYSVDDVVPFCFASEELVSSSHLLSSPSRSSSSKARIVIPASSFVTIDEKLKIIDDGGDDEIYDYVTDLECGSEMEKPLFNSNLQRRLRIIGPMFGQQQQQQQQQQQKPTSVSSLYKKTGTTIAGCVVIDKNGKEFCILGADTRATEGTIVADKRCDKIHKLSSNCRCCGAGTSADLDQLTRRVLFQVALQQSQRSYYYGQCPSSPNGPVVNTSLSSSSALSSVLSDTYNNNVFSGGGGGDGGVELLYQEYDDDAKGDPLLWMRPVSIDLLCNLFQDMLFRAKGQLGVNLIVGGVFNGKAHLRAIHPHGSMDSNLPFAALGSGGLAAMSVLESGFSNNLSVGDASDLVKRAILSGIKNDLGSGSQVDICVIGPEGTATQTRGYLREEELLPDSIGDNGNALTKTNRLSEILGTTTDGKKDESSTKINLGVNGFGNQPFAVERIEQRMVSTEIDESELKKKWDHFLGLD